MANNNHIWHTLGVDEIIAELNTSPSGLSKEEASERLKQYGPNELAREVRISPFQILIRQFNSPLIYVLFIAAIISFAVDHLLDAFVILGIVVINSIIGFFQEYRAEKSMQALRKLAAPQATVIREAQRVTISTMELVPGDVIALVTGDKVPADARVIDSKNLKTDEASLTGESVPVDKQASPITEDTSLAERSNMVYAATTVTYGRGEAVIIATGSSTEVGKIARDVASVGHEDTPLQVKLASVGRILGIIALGLALFRFVMGLIQGIDFIDILLFAIASAVASIPEGLPAVVTIVLAIGLKRMAARNAIVRELPAVETLGSATVICSDKTGTLTKNEMTVKALYIYGREYEITGEGYEPQGEIRLDGKPVDISEDEDLQFALTAGALCNDAHLNCQDSQCKISGDPTEGALITAAEKASLTKSELSKRMPRINEIPFDSERAYMATLHDIGDKRVVFVKGALEKLIHKCSFVRSNSQVQEFDKQKQDTVMDTNRDLASRALRVLALAYKEVPLDKNDLAEDDLRDGLVFLGLAGMIDPPRPEAIIAIERCNRAGIRVIMATGDNKITAGAIASQMGILKPGNLIVDGRELKAMSDDELDDRIDNIDVFARVEPVQKLRIVNALKHQGHIVAVTGDGVNDAPALKRADIGVAMGITGTDVAKEASEMVLTDDNFASIVGAVEEGRIIFANIKKVVTYLLSTNAGEDLILIVTILAAFPLPLTPVQILWINLVTDSFPGLALAADPPREDVLAEPPLDKESRIISRGVLFRLVFVASIMTIGSVSLFYWAWTTKGLVEARTVTFAVIAIFQLFNAFNVRSPHTSIFKIGFLTNRWLVVAAFIGLVLQIAVIHLPFMQTLFNTVPLTASEWLLIIAVASSVLWAEEIRKRVAPGLVD